MHVAAQVTAHLAVQASVQYSLLKELCRDGVPLIEHFELISSHKAEVWGEYFAGVLLERPDEIELCITILKWIAESPSFASKLQCNLTNLETGGRLVDVESFAALTGLIIDAGVVGVVSLR